MWGLLALLTGGLFLSVRSKPKTKVNKRQAFGPRSGETWDVEDFPDANMIVVHSRRDQTVGVFHRDKTTKRFVFAQGKGSPTLLGMMREDFEGEAPPA